MQIAQFNCLFNLRVLFYLSENEHIDKVYERNFDSDGKASNDYYELKT